MIKRNRIKKERSNEKKDATSQSRLEVARLLRRGVRIDLESAFVGQEEKKTDGKNQKRD